MHKPYIGDNSNEHDIYAVQKYLEEQGITYATETHINYMDHSDGADAKKYDVVVSIAFNEDGEFLGENTFTFEVNYESPERWNKWGQYGFEGEKYADGRYFDKSKSVYSEADFWLFYTIIEGEIEILGVYEFKGQEAFFRYAERYLNAGEYHGNSYNERTGKHDSYMSTVYFVDPGVIEPLRVISFYPDYCTVRGAECMGKYADEWFMAEEWKEARR